MNQNFCFINTINNVKKLYLGCCIATMIVFAGCQQESQSTNKTTPSSLVLSSNASTLPVAYVNLDTLKLYHELYADLEDRMKSEKRKAQRQFTAKRQQFQTELQNFQRRAQNGLVSQKEMETKSRQFQAKEQELMIQERNLTEGLVITEQDLVKEWFESLTAYLEKYNKDKRYQIIFPYQATTFLYVDNALDITADVLKGLNEEYESNKEEEKKEKKSSKQEENEKKSK